MLNATAAAILTAAEIAIEIEAKLEVARAAIVALELKVAKAKYNEYKLVVFRLTNEGETITTASRKAEAETGFDLDAYMDARDA